MITVDLCPKYLKTSFFLGNRPLESDEISVVDTNKLNLDPDPEF